MVKELTMQDIPVRSQDTLEIACKEIEWAEQEVTVSSVEQYLKIQLWHRPYVVQALIAVFVAHWNSPVEETEVAS